MDVRNALVIGGGIGGLCAGIALRQKGIAVDIIERDPEWSVYGVGIIQQMNSIRAMHELQVLDDYLSRAYGFDRTTLFVGPQGHKEAEFDAPRLAGAEYPSNAGILRRDLQKVLGDKVAEVGCDVRLGLTVTDMDDDGTGVDVTYSDGSSGRYDIVVGADGVFSTTRRMILPDAPTPRYTGQWVWRYNLPRPPEVEGIHIFAGPCNAGLTPLNEDLMYMFLLSEEPEGFKLPVKGSAAAMQERARRTMAPPQIAAYLDQITDDAEVVARPLEVILLDDDWHKGRVVLIGDAVHAATPHLAQGAGMAIEDALVLADELGKHDTPDAAFSAYRARRMPRVVHVAKTSILIGDAQMGKVPPVDVGALNGQTMGLMAQPI
ncbi:FAD-dependent oxidoreductase [Maritimibacter dapengensis]|uniref:FAD-dependent oxidoreductase n=1 Tax=Maritimibacter dapengensis TaxID=2836868 RepID=A0ABS6T1Q0_9RHOB|nr:FAD-dependent oxidoreductase [Maritimibacter dapengensis]MBV7378511.1 FAD-dependent oxidoreductase [Maritimibacter dapengensis]